MSADRNRLAAIRTVAILPTINNTTYPAIDMLDETLDAVIREMNLFSVVQPPELSEVYADLKNNPVTNITYTAALRDIGRRLNVDAVVVCVLYEYTPGTAEVASDQTNSSTWGTSLSSEKTQMKEGKSVWGKTFVDLLVPDIVLFGMTKHRYKTEIASAYLSVGVTVLDVATGCKVYVAARDISAFMKLPGCRYYTYDRVLGESVRSGKILAELAFKEMLYPAKLIRSKGE